MPQEKQESHEVFCSFHLEFAFVMGLSVEGLICGIEGVNSIVLLHCSSRSIPCRVQSAGAGGRGDGVKRLQQIGNDAAENDDWEGCAHKFQVGRERCSENPKGISSFSPALDDGVGLRWVDESHKKTTRNGLHRFGGRGMQPRCGRCFVWTMSQGSSFLATLG